MEFCLCQDCGYYVEYIKILILASRVTSNSEFSDNMKNRLFR